MTKLYTALIPVLLLMAAGVAAAGDDNVRPGREAAIRKVMFAYGDHNVVRSGPGPNYSLAAVLPEGASFEVIAKSGPWINVALSENESGWVHESLCYQYDDLSDLELRPNPRLYSRIGCFMATAYAGGYSFDRKSNSLIVGGRLGYYLLDFLQFEGGAGWTLVERPQEVVESLFDLSLEAEKFHMLFYEMNANVMILPGRRVVPFVGGGIGSSIFQGKTAGSVNYGAGTLFYVARRAAIRWELRDYRFVSGTGNAERRNNNIVFTMGTSLLY